MPKASKEHDERLKQFKTDLEGEGWRVILLNEKSPDGIAVKDGKICAVEVIAKRLITVGKYKGKYKKEGKVRYAWKMVGGATFTNKRRTYSMFDDVLFAIHYREETDHRKLTKKRKQRSNFLKEKGSVRILK